MRFAVRPSGAPYLATSPHDSEPLDVALRRMIT
jgi:hypothetical protein